MTDPAKAAEQARERALRARARAAEAVDRAKRLQEQRREEPAASGDELAARRAHKRADDAREREHHTG